MTISETLVPGKPMSESAASAHLTALIRANHQRNNLRYDIESSQPLDRVGIVGAGVMGSIVGASAIRHDVPIVITDQNPEALTTIKQGIRRRIHSESVEPIPDIDERLADLVTVTSRLEDVAACDLVVESIVENVTTKRNFYIGLEKLCDDDTIIVSNTSTLPIAELAAHLRHPHRFCGLHYFPPIGEQKMVEVIPSSKTSEVVTSRLVKFSERIGRLPIVVADGRGFVVNRILMAYMSGTEFGF